ncbi:MAG: hypothetical protein ACJ74W_10415 [Pyrinomonadaceae bacterium]
MRFSAINLKQWAGTLFCGAALAFGCTTAYGQDRHDVRKFERHELKQHQKFERRELKDRFRTERRLYGNNSDWRMRRQSERTALRLHQRTERLVLKQRYNPGRHLGRGYYRAPGQRFYGPPVRRARFRR